MYINAYNISIDIYECIIKKTKYKSGGIREKSSFLSETATVPIWQGRPEMRMAGVPK